VTTPKRSRAKTRWFNAIDGPKELFDRVRFVMEKQTFVLNLEDLQGHVGYFMADELAALQNINLAEWKVEAAEVLKDKGKFVSSTWRRKIGHRSWRITIDRGNVVRAGLFTAADKLPREKHPASVLNFVAEVNRKLMQGDGQVPTPGPGPKPAQKPVPGIDFPKPVSRKKARPRARFDVPLPVRSAAPRPQPEPPPSIYNLRLMAQSEPNRRRPKPGLCRHCGKPAVFGADTCYSCG
jgi:hypothetical protein